MKVHGIAADLAPIVILPVPGPVVTPPTGVPEVIDYPRNQNPGIVPPWLANPITIQNDNGGIVPPWLRTLLDEHAPHVN